VVLPRLDTDLTGLLAEAASGALRSTPRFTDESAVCVVMAAEGYPESPRPGDLITGLDDAGSMEGVTVFHAGTGRAADGLVTTGGRVLGVTALGPTLEDARSRAYRAVGAISWPGAHARSDIAAAAAADAVGTDAVMATNTPGSAR
jgi:phosphoribosylamine---glycine ligase